MNLAFKLKHYLAPYLLTRPSYEYDKSVKSVEANYWIKGYRQNIENAKWAVEDGIPMGLYNNIPGIPIAKRVHVAGLCEFCFALKEMDREGEIQKVVEFILENLNEVNGDLPIAFWKTYFKPKEDSYYVHGMGQGQLLSLLVRYYQKNQDKRALDAMIKISNSYLVDFADPNGFVNRQAERVVFEEYPKAQELNPHVLNGWTLSVIGLSDYISTFNEQIDPFYSEKKGLLVKSIETLKNELDRYDLHFWSCYNQPRSILNIGSVHYHIQHIAFLNALGYISGDIAFTKKARKFARQFYNPIFRILAFFSKVFISNGLKYGRIYKTS